MGLEFCAASHVYTLDGVRLPAVTDILKAAGIGADYAGIPPSVLQHAADRGHYVDACCGLYDQNALDWAAIDHRARGYVASWASFRSKEQWRPLLEQPRVYHAGFLYAGTPDTLGEWQGRPAILDRKAVRQLAPSYRLQTAAYAMPGIVLPEGEVTEGWARLVVQLKPDGTYRVEVHEDPQDFEAFLGALAVARWKEAVDGARAERRLQPGPARAPGRGTTV